MDEDAREALVAAVQVDWRGAELGPVDRALCEFAERLTRTPAAMREADVDVLVSA